MGRTVVVDSMRIFAISGSLQRGSTNTVLLQVASRVAPEGVDIDLYDSLGHLPHFNPDLDGDDPPERVVDLRARLLAADAVLIASPEYAHEMPGSLKNALDWVVGSGELYGKRVALMSAAPGATRAVLARAALAQTLNAQGAMVVHSTTVSVLRSQVDGGRISDPQIIQQVDETLETLVDRSL
jgi:chromate reductase, NAD(P)H dehydrogenase (quinone)